MERRDFDLQLKLIRATVAHESRRSQPVDMEPLRLRAFRILEDLEAEVNGDSELLDAIAEVREEIG